MTMVVRYYGFRGTLTTSSYTKKTLELYIGNYSRMILDGHLCILMLLGHEIRHKNFLLICKVLNKRIMVGILFMKVKNILAIKCASIKKGIGRKLHTHILTD